MIKFYIPNSEPLENIKRASRRFRAMIPLRGMRPNDKIIDSLDQVKPGDIVVVAKKIKQQEVLYLKNIEAKVVYDICDSKWHKPYAVEQLNDSPIILNYNKNYVGDYGKVTAKSDGQDITISFIVPK
jgi:hypothetical protein